MATVTKRGDSYRIKVSYGYDVNGKQVVQTKTWKPEPDMTARQIKKELDRQCVMFEEECKKGQVVATIKFETFAEQWFEEYAKINLRNTSFERMKQLTARVYPAIGHLRLDKITGRHIQQFINDLINSTSERTGRPLARKTVIHHLSFISDVFSYAVKMDMLTYNPCRKVTVPKGEAKEKDIYTIEEITRIFELLDGENVPTKFRVFFKLAVYSGYRRSELLGLEWKDVDFENNLISVRRTSCYTAKKGIYTDTTKTKRSQRTIKFPASVMELLKQFKAEQDELAQQVGDKWIDSDRLFVKWNGEPMNNNTPYFWLNEFCEKHGLPFYGLHSFRHLFASMLVNEGVDIVTVSGALGHSTVSTTSNIYCHLLENSQAKVSEAITNVLKIGASDGSASDSNAAETADKNEAS